MQFSNQSLQGTHPIASWQWDFGDGGTSNEENPTHVYTNPGTYTVKLTVSDGTLSDSIEKSNLITVTEVVTGPTAGFSANPTSGTAPLQVSFSDASVQGTNPISSWQWDFGDGGTSSEKNPQHVYASAGTDRAQVWTRDSSRSDIIGMSNLITVTEV
ncbi:MAG: PKD domain-containing protein, partial [Calditrichaeota bacterium]|nr:PKD domain-containing protein [Calditrichota bacterium]